MIVKKVANPKKSASKSTRIRSLASYITSPEATNSEEKCIYSGSRGFMMDDRASQVAEMVALAQLATRSKDPINHYVLSWQEGEQPAAEQIEEAVGIFLDELGLKEHQAIYALHADTDNTHLHLMVNRVHPETLKVVEINRGFDLEAAHKGVSKIEAAQGWRREKKGRYIVTESGEVERTEQEPKKRKEPRQARKDMEERTGTKSAQRIAIEAGADIIKKAQSWEQLHRELAAEGLRYERVGSGAKIWVGEVPVKASDVDRAASLSQLQKRLGAYQAAPAGLQIAKREAEPLKQGTPLWREYAAQRKQHFEAKKRAYADLGAAHVAQRKELQAAQKAERAELKGTDWHGRGVVLNAMRSVLAAKHAAERAELKEKQVRERALKRQQFRPWPSLEDWYKLQNSPELAEAWRMRREARQRLEGEVFVSPVPAKDIRAFRAEVDGGIVRYIHQDRADGFAAFIDRGKQLDVQDWQNEASTLAALQLAAQKFGGAVTLNGNDEFKRMAAALAVQHNIRILNPELANFVQECQQEHNQAHKYQQRSSGMER